MRLPFLLQNILHISQIGPELLPERSCCHFWHASSKYFRLLLLLDDDNNLCVKKDESKWIFFSLSSSFCALPHSDSRPKEVSQVCLPRRQHQEGDLSTALGSKRKLDYFIGRAGRGGGENERRKVSQGPVRPPVDRVSGVSPGRPSGLLALLSLLSSLHRSFSPL